MKERDRGLDETLQAGLADTQAASPASIAGKTAPSLPSTLPPVLTSRHAAVARAGNVLLIALSTANLVYFVARFLMSATPPTMHPAFVGEVHGAAFQAMDIFNGPFLTLARVTLVVALIIIVSSWAAIHHRNDTLVQLVMIMGALAGQLTISVAVLTSSETWLAPRIVAVLMYVLMPVASFGFIALFPDGRAVPRWSLYALPVGVAPFAIQAAIMASSHDYSVPVGIACFPVGLLFFGFQWHRYRRHASLRQRHQIKWAVYAAAIFVALQFVTIAMIPLLANRERAVFPFLRVTFELVLASSYLLPLACLLFSAARYRLWAIDRVINRTVVYAIVTGLLGAACALGYFGLRAILSSLFHGSAIIGAAIAIGLMVALFTPTRRHIARFIDRKFYGIGLDYEWLAAKVVRAANTALPTTGTELAGFEELVLLGRGGMGAVYRAHHPEFGVPVALKVMSPQLAMDAEAQARFRREGELLERLEHPNIIPFLAAGHDKGLAFIAMQYVEGEDLGVLVRKHGKLAVGEVTPIVDGIAAALDAAHRRGVVHRDIKPANVLVEAQTSQPYVLDFGVAHVEGDVAAADGSLVGSLPYIAPEQIQNGDGVDGRADVYALAATTYEALTGRPPFVESTALGLVLAHLHQPPADPRSFVPDLSPDIGAALLRGLAKSPADRFATAGELAAALRSAL